MAAIRWARIGGFILAVLAGCNTTPDRESGTGAKEVAQKFFEALGQRDWPAAYAKLHPDSRSKVTEDQFRRLAERYRNNLPFEPASVHIRAWNEQNGEATVQVNLSTPAGEKVRRHRDAIQLRRGDEGWGILLPANFGRINGP